MNYSAVSIGSGPATEPTSRPSAAPASWLLRYRAFALAALLVGATALVLKLMEYVLDSRDLTVLFLVPIVFCAWKLGQGPALWASFLSVLISATFIFEPLFDPRIASRHHLTHLVVFLITAVIAGRIAHDARRANESLAARHRETEALYNFSRRLTNLSTPTAIYAAMRDHLASELGERFVLVAPEGREDMPIATEQQLSLPRSVADAIRSANSVPLSSQGLNIVAPEDGSSWIIKPLHPTKSDLGMIAVRVASGDDAGIDAREHTDATLRDAVLRLQRLDVELALHEARLREKSEEFREALIGSVTHDLRTPIATIMGSASVLSKSAPISTSEDLSALTRLITLAAGNLDQKIANLIDATRISSEGVKPHPAWVDPTDIVSAALRESEAALVNHKLVRAVPSEPPLIHTDPVLLKEVLRQFLDNATKYSPPDSEITVCMTIDRGALVISVNDRGAGMTQSEIDHAFERFYRGPMQIGKSAGTGIGLWISQAFALACNAEIRIASNGAGQGTSASVVVPLRSTSPQAEPVHADE